MLSRSWLQQPCQSWRGASRVRALAQALSSSGCTHRSSNTHPRELLSSQWPPRHPSMASVSSPLSHPCHLDQPRSRIMYPGLTNSEEQTLTPYERCSPATGLWRVGVETSGFSVCQVGLKGKAFTAFKWGALCNRAKTEVPGQEIRCCLGLNPSCHNTDRFFDR